MKALLYFNLTDKSVSTGTGAWTPPPLTFGEDMNIGLRFQENLDDTPTEVSADVRYLKAALGSVDARPTDGTFCLKIGDAPQSTANTTGALPWNAGASAIATAINALPTVVAQYGTVAVVATDSSLVFRFGTGAVNVPIALANDMLEPASVALASAWQVAGQWVQELRIVQAPAAFTDSSVRILPDAPSITSVQVGGTDVDYTWNTIQQMEMPPAFRGTYQFRFNSARTVLLSRDDDTTAIAAALAVFGSGITVTNPRDGVARIEFGGAFAGLPEPLLEVIVVDAPEGDLTFALGLDEPGLAAMLRTVPQVTLPLEVELGIGDTSVAGGVRVEKFRVSITIQRGLIFGLLATAAGIDWLRPIPKDYVPFTMDQIFQGQLYYASPLGNGAALSFVVDHQLASDAIASVLLRENIADGRVLVLGTDYTVSYGGANSLTVTLTAGTTPPATAGLLVVITAAGMRDAFLAHTHTIDQVVGLEARLEQVEQRVTVLETYLPSTTPTLSDTTASALTITIPARTEVLFYNPAKLDLTALPARAPALLPAVHQAAMTALPTPLPVPTLNAVWSAASRTLIPGTARIAASYVDAGGFVASDGRLLYPASQAAGTVSYYPAPFERTLWEFPINEAQLQIGKTLDAEFFLAAQLLNATSEAQWVVVIEWGLPVDQSDPANEGQNLQTIAWNAAPILTQRIYVTPLLMTHSFGCRIQRTSSGITADNMRYGGWQTAGTAVPTGPNFVLRARLVEFDTRNNVPDATGWLYYALGGTNATGPATVTIG